MITRKDWLSICERDSNYTDAELLEAARLNRLHAAIDRRQLIEAVRELTKESRQLLDVEKRRDEFGYQREYHEIRADLTAALTPFEEGGMSDWQPIESAPKDGTRVLCSFCKGEAPEVLYFSQGMWYSELEREGQSSFIFQPSHWMPLPEPPK
jgi:uncharacterized protein DUF551